MCILFYRVIPIEWIMAVILIDTRTEDLNWYKNGRPDQQWTKPGNNRARHTRQTKILRRFFSSRGARPNVSSTVVSRMNTGLFGFLGGFKKESFSYDNKEYANGILTKKKICNVGKLQVIFEHKGKRRRWPTLRRTRRFSKKTEMKLYPELTFERDCRF